MFNRVLDLGMALLILWAYATPAWLRRFMDLPRESAGEAPPALAPDWVAAR